MNTNTIATTQQNILEDVIKMALDFQEGREIVKELLLYVYDIAGMISTNYEGEVFEGKTEISDKILELIEQIDE